MADGRRPENFHSLYEDGEVIHNKRAFEELSQWGAWANEDLFTTIFNPLKLFDALQADHLIRTGETILHSNQKIGPACIEGRLGFAFKDLPEFIESLRGEDVSQGPLSSSFIFRAAASTASTIFW